MASTKQTVLCGQLCADTPLPFACLFHVSVCLCMCVSTQCTLPILAKCGGNYVKYLATW